MKAIAYPVTLNIINNNRMTTPTLLILAAGMGSRYGGLKQMDPIGPSGETLMDYSIYDAMRAGFSRVVFVLRREIEDDFRRIVAARFEKHVNASYVLQEMTDLPAGFSVPEGRTKPWGTTHAVLAARAAIDTPFAVINADDFYGAESFRTLANHLASGSQDYALAGYTLRNTLSPHGPVARGVCQVDSNSFLLSVTELTAISPEGSSAVMNADGKTVHLTGDEIVSLNFWGFTTSVFPQLRASFETFLAASGTSLTAECYLPSTIGHLVQTHAARVRVLPTSDAWVGVTYRADREHTIEHVADLIRSGAYPARLWE